MRLFKGKAKQWGAVCVVSAIVFWRLLAAPPPSLLRPSATVVFDKQGGFIGARASSDGRMWRVPIERSQLPKHLVDAVLTFEDKRFYLHPGIDPVAILRAAFLNLSSGRVVSGGSTLTMQLARMLGRRPRTLTAKLKEALIALRLEYHHEKDELLVAYLNLTPYGGNIEGVGAAALFYYGKPIWQLTLDEAATLSAIPNAPERLRPDRKKAKVRLKARRNDVLSRMEARGIISADAAQRAKALSVHARRSAAPKIAPHLVRRLTKGAGTVVRSSIDPSLQQLASSMLRAHISQLSRRGVSNGAVVIIENETRAVRALVGSANFDDVAAQGQVDGSAAQRSPGSTLKPFVYALALDRGLIGMHTPLYDVPLVYKDWAPKNFDGQFHGAVDLRYALTRSLNIPAVWTLETLGVFELGQLLKRAGFSTFLKRGASCGLTSVLGGCEASLLELSNLYATLASGGQHRALTMVEEGAAATTELFSKGAAYLITEVLTDVGRPRLAGVWKDSTSVPTFAWKTGTSFGHRDAWSIGYNRRYTVGVWLGNFDGKGARALVGVVAAAPLFFSIARALPGADFEPWFERPAEVKTKMVCALSGRAPAEACPNKKESLAIHELSDVCELHSLVDIDDQTGRRLCARCRTGRKYHQALHVMWPERVNTWLQRKMLPPHNPDCEKGLPGAGPSIESPQDGDLFMLRAGVSPKQQEIALRALAAPGEETIFWFIDDLFVGSSKPGEPQMIVPRAGQHRVVAVDGEGRSSAINFGVTQGFSKK